MEQNKYLLISLGDEKAKKLSEVLGNSTCNKILEFLADKSEVSEKDISTALKMPLNTVEYNLKKLLTAELIEKSQKFFWSTKGKKIDLYKLSNKSIIISQKGSDFFSKFKFVLPLAVISGFVTYLIRTSHEVVPQLASYNVVQDSAKMMASAPEFVQQTTTATIGSPLYWTIGGFILPLAIFLIVYSILRFERRFR